MVAELLPFCHVHSLTPSLPHSPRLPGIFRQPWLVQLLTQAWEAHVVILIRAHFCTSATVWDTCVWLTDRDRAHIPLIRSFNRAYAYKSVTVWDTCVWLTDRDRARIPLIRSFNRANACKSVTVWDTCVWLTDRDHAHIPLIRSFNRAYSCKSALVW